MWFEWVKKSTFSGALLSCLGRLTGFRRWRLTDIQMIKQKVATEAAGLYCGW